MPIRSHSENCSMVVAMVNLTVSLCFSALYQSILLKVASYYGHVVFYVFKLNSSRLRLYLWQDSITCFDLYCALLNVLLPGGPPNTHWRYCFSFTSRHIKATVEVYSAENLMAGPLQFLLKYVYNSPLRWRVWNYWHRLRNYRRQT